MSHSGRLAFQPAYSKVERTFRRGEKYQKPPGAANFCIREWRPRTPVSYQLDFALMGRRATIASQGRPINPLGGCELPAGACPSTCGPGNLQGAMVALEQGRFGKGHAIIAFYVRWAFCVALWWH